MRKVRQLLHDSSTRAQEVQREPAVVLQWLRSSLVNTWNLRGGGFYGLIFLLVFVFLQLQTIALDLLESDSAVDFLTSQIFEAMFKFLTATFTNMLQAFLWPFLFINWIGSWGIPILIAAFLSFDRWGKPYINERIPELGAANLEREAKRLEKKQAKQKAKASKKSKSHSKTP